MSEKSELTPFQLALLLVHAQIGVGMITLAVEVHNYAKSDSWISVLIAGVLIQLIIVLFVLLLKRFPGRHYFEILEIIFGKYIGKLFILVYCAYFMAIGAILFAKYTVILKSWMMPLTPQWVLVALIALVGIYAAKENLQVISRFFILATVVIFVFFGFVIYALKDANYTYILPIGQSGLMSILKGAYTTSLSFQGFEYMLFFAPLALAKRNEILKTTTITNAFITFFYTFVVLTTHLFFSTEEFKLLTEPIFYLVKSFSFKIIERPDLIFTSMWIVLVVTSTVVLFYVISLGFQSVFKRRKRKPFVYIATFISFLLSNLLYGEGRIKTVTEYFGLFTLVLTIIFPIIVLFISLLFRKKGEEQ